MPNWGDFKINKCMSRGKSQQASVLWNILGSWEDACNRQDATLNGKYFSKPSRCITNTNEWGEFDDVPDSRCDTNWDNSKWEQIEGCVEPGIAKYKNDLIFQHDSIKDIYNEVCKQTPGNIGSFQFSGADSCIKYTTPTNGTEKIIGYVNAPTSSCDMKFEQITSGSCRNDGIREYRGKIIAPQGINASTGCDLMINKNIVTTLPNSQTMVHSRCEVEDDGVYAVWVTTENNCKIKYGDLIKNSCDKSTPGFTTTYAKITFPEYLTASEVCTANPHPTLGVPSKCIQHTDGFWYAEWVIPETSCVNSFESIANNSISDCVDGFKQMIKKFKTPFTNSYTDSDFKVVCENTEDTTELKLLPYNCEKDSNGDWVAKFKVKCTDAPVNANANAPVNANTDTTVQYLYIGNLQIPLTSFNILLGIMILFIILR